MINQQVNLYQPMFRKERRLLTFRVLLQSAAAVLALLMVMYGYGVQQTRQVQADLDRLQAQFDQRVAQVAELTGRLSRRSGDNGATRELARLEREMEARRRVVSALTRAREAYTRGVSGYLEGFARQTPKGVWLTSFVVQAGGEGLVIRGSARSPGLVPGFLQALSHEQALAGTRFGLLQIQREDRRARRVDFTLYTGDEPPPAPQDVEDGS